MARELQDKLWRPKPGEELVRHLQAVENVNPHEINELARHWIDPDKLVIVLRGPAEALKIQLEQASLGPVEIVEKL